MKQISKNIVLLCLLHFCTISSIIAQSIKYGLGFNSFEIVQEKRTGLNLTPNKPFSFPNGFSLSFDVSFLPNSKFSYGYVFRIIGQDKQHIDFVLNKTDLIITHSLGRAITDFSFSEIDYDYNGYIPFEIQFDIKNSTLNISLKGKRISTKAVSMKDFKEVSIIFGKCDYPQFQVSDIPKMSIKDIRINDLKGNSIYFWSLAKHAQDGVYDELKKRFAQVENPLWILNDHVSWKRQVSFNTTNNPQICYNQDKNIVVISDKNTFHLYNIDYQTLKEENLKNGIQDKLYTNHMGYNPTDRSYYSYFDVMDSIISFDTITNSWNNTNKERTAAFYWHHNKIISPYDNCLYTFGGYGHHMYNNSINKYDFNTDTWEKLHFNGDRI